FAARVAEEPDRASQVSSLVEQGIDWDYLLRVARIHGMMPLLYQMVRSTCLDAVPVVVANQLTDCFQQTVRRNLMMCGELLRILKLFSANGISAIPFKG